MADSSPIDDAPPPAAAEANATYDFSAAAGPLPTPVIARIAAACRNWRGCGSALSLPFTSEACRELMRDTRARMCRVLAIPGTHDVLFLQGGASAQFSLVPLNLLGQAGSAAYLISGYLNGEVHLALPIGLTQKKNSSGSSTGNCGDLLWETSQINLRFSYISL